MSIRLLIADDQALVRGGFRAILDAEPDIDVVAEAGDGAEALDLTRRHRVDVVLMDIRMPRLDGIEATRRLLAEPRNPPTRVLVLTTFDLDEYVYEALRAGASGFLLKDVRPEQLAPAVRTVAGGEALLAPSVTRRLIEEFARRPVPGGPSSASLQQLTPRERDVLILVARGMSNLEIAERLFVGESTVKTHVAHVLSKLGARDRIHAVVFAYESGLVQPGQP
ncbi:MAG TPA: response regulator transcription factor [Jiangellaceae bacterium]|nr:response regulator transcription factor [Jiangellaceae bacterium]